MTRTIEPKRLGALLTLLGQLERLHEELAGVVRAKIDAMRHADIRALQQRVEREHGLVQRIQRCEGSRRRMMDVIGEQLGLSPRSARAMTVSQLVRHVPDRRREAILEAAERLRGGVCRVAKANRVAGMVAHELVAHLERVFAAVGPAGERGIGYTGDGAAVAQRDDRIFEVVG